MKKDPVTRIYQLRIALRHTKPEIWRRVLVAGQTNLNNLHYIIQTAMGWENMHLHLFQVGDVLYSDPEMKVSLAKDEFSAKLFRIAPKKGDAFVYEYDFGDSWNHDVKVEAVSESDVREFNNEVQHLGGKMAERSYPEWLCTDAIDTCRASNAARSCI